jgi:hypothetical protein
MNGKQRARWAADIMSELQRLRKHTKGHPDDEWMGKAYVSMQTGRDLALKEHGDEEKDGKE